MRRVLLIGCCRVGLTTTILKNCSDIVFIDESVIIEKQKIQSEFVFKIENDPIPFYNCGYAESEEPILYESKPSKFIVKPKNNFKIR